VLSIARCWVLRQQGFRSAFAEIVLPNPGSVRLHQEAGFRQIGVHKDIGFKLGRWHDIGYWRMGLADTDSPSTRQRHRRAAAFCTS
jgi:phosphinothricin acetyltransferase